MASFLSSPGASAAILLCPTARAGLGSARVALVVTDLPGRDVTPLPGLGIQSPFLSQDFTAMGPRSVLMSALSKDSDAPHLTDFCSKLDDMRSLYMQTLTAAGPDTVERNGELQMKLEVVAEESGNLLRQVVGRLNPAPDSVLYKDLFDMGMKITGVEVSARARRAPWGFAHALSHELDGLRRLASAALNIPLPPKTPEVPPVLMENDEIEVTVLAMLDAQYHSVAADLELMFT